MLLGGRDEGTLSHVIGHDRERLPTDSECATDLPIVGVNTKFNLMEEMKTIRRVVEKQAPEKIPTILVLDATTGQNALLQAKQFQAAVPIDRGLVAKLDGTAKGALVFAIANELKIPICVIGTGEKITDIAEFDADRFVEALLSEPQEDER